MLVTLRPNRRFRLHCPDIYETDLFQRQRIGAWRIPRSCDPSTYRHGCDPPDSTESVVESRHSALARNPRYYQHVVPPVLPTYNRSRLVSFLFHSRGNSAQDPKAMRQWQQHLCR